MLICLPILDHWCPVCCPGESLNKTERNCKVSDICVKHTTCAFSDHPFLLQYKHSSYSLPHLKAEKLLCTFCSISLPAKADSEQKEKTALLFQLWLFKTFLSDSVRLPENVSWMYSMLYVLNPSSFHSPLKLGRLVSPGLQIRKQ